MVAGFFKFSMARAEFFGRIDARESGLEGADFASEFADVYGELVFLRLQTRQGSLQRFQPLGAASAAEAIARGFDK